MLTVDARYCDQLFSPESMSASEQAIATVLYITKKAMSTISRTCQPTDTENWGRCGVALSDMLEWTAHTALQATRDVVVRDGA
jgi:hypothetical protein